MEHEQAKRESSAKASVQTAVHLSAVNYIHVIQKQVCLHRHDCVSKIVCLDFHSLQLEFVPRKLKQN